MIKYLLPILLVATFISCHLNKSAQTKPSSNKESFLNSEFAFNDCDDFKDFLKVIIVNNMEDTTVQKNYFTIPYIKSSYKFSKDIFHADCFIGISVKELDEIFGERAILKTQSGKIVTTTTGVYSDWYYLNGDNIKLAFDIYINNNTVENFRITPHAVEKTSRGKNN